jgi:hypothetical protein
MARCSTTLLIAAVLLAVAAPALAQGGWNTGRATFCEY